MRERAKQMGSVAAAGGETAHDRMLPPVPTPEANPELGIQPTWGKKRPDSPPWPSTAVTEQPVQLSLFG